jgi:hypothetical protein
MEHVYPRVPDTDIREVYVREVGSSRIAYVPWDIDRAFWEVMAVDHGRLLGSIVKWAMGEEPPATVTGRGLIDVTVWRQKESMTVHLVNLTNPMMMKGPFRELLPIDEQKVRVRLPARAEAKGVRLLVSDAKADFETDGRTVALTVPSILDHEVVAIDL